MSSNASDAVEGSLKRPIIIVASSTPAGFAAMDAWLEKQFGKQGTGWLRKAGSHGRRPDGRVIDTSVVLLKSGEERVVHFDITAFYGKF